MTFCRGVRSLNVIFTAVLLVCRRPANPARIGDQALKDAWIFPQPYRARLGYLGTPLA